MLVKARLPSAMAQVMRAAAIESCQDVLRDLGEIEAIRQTRKGTPSFVAFALRRIEKRLITAVLKGRSDEGVMTRSAYQSGATGSGDFLLASMDGVANFSRGVPHFAVTLAYRYRGDVLASVVYDVARGELFEAWQGGGARLEHQRIRCNNTEPLRLRDCIIGIEGTPAHTAKTQPQFRCLGAASLALAWVACGRWNGFIADALPLPIAAAGGMLVREAGGLVDTTETPQRSVPKVRILAAHPNCYVNLKRLHGQNP